MKEIKKAGKPYNYYINRSYLKCKSTANSEKGLTSIDLEDTAAKDNTNI